MNASIGHSRLLFFPALLMLATLPQVVWANTSGVFSPDVKAGDRMWEYRTSFEPNDGGVEDVFSHRLHYQHALNDQSRLRLIGLQSDNGGDLEFRYMRVEYQYQYLEDEDAGWDSALRFELQIAEGDDLPHRFRVAWTGKVDVTDRWQLRANLITGREFHSGADSGLSVETRWQATYAVGGGTRFGIEAFNDLNTTDDFGGFNEQEHQAGPIVKMRLGRGWSLDFSYLFGLSDDAPDENLRMHLKYSL
ncbi:MAG: transporter [Pseudomonadaceae bacterium]|nr:transporter [Pseudomonadaceae bacterium]